MDSYVLYLDKPNVLECTVSLEGASLKEAVARVILEQDGHSTMFEGEISENGECSIKMERLKEIVSDGDTGHMKLEIIAGDVYFQPWDTNYTVDLFKKIRVEVKTPTAKKPTAKIQIVSPQVKEYKSLVETIVQKLETDGVDASNINKHKQLFRKIVGEHTKTASYTHDTSTMISDIVKLLAH
jgi:hypothetical protein